jgi:hypothetical protein
MMKVNTMFFGGSKRLLRFALFPPAMLLNSYLKTKIRLKRYPIFIIISGEKIL